MGSTDKERLKVIAEQVLGGRKLVEIDFGEPNLGLDEKLRKVDLALKHYPNTEAAKEPQQGKKIADLGSLLSVARQ